MRTVILILGYEFAGILTKHWEVPTSSSEAEQQFMLCLLILCVILDIVKK